MRGFSGNWRDCVDGRGEAINGSVRIARRSLAGDQEGSQDRGDRHRSVPKDDTPPLQNPIAKNMNIFIGDIALRGLDPDYGARAFL